MNLKAPDAPGRGSRGQTAENRQQQSAVCTETAYEMSALQSPTSRTIASRPRNDAAHVGPAADLLVQAFQPPARSSSGVSFITASLSLNTRLSDQVGRRRCQESPSTLGEIVLFIRWAMRSDTRLLRHNMLMRSRNHDVGHGWRDEVAVIDAQRRLHLATLLQREFKHGRERWDEAEAVWRDMLAANETEALPSTTELYDPSVLI